MHPFLQAYQARQTLLSGGASERPYYQASEINTYTNVTRPVVYNASSYASQNKSIKKKKRRPKASGNSSESYSSSSESDGEGNRRSKKKKGRCWKGYEPTPGVKPYADGSCQKK